MAPNQLRLALVVGESRPLSPAMPQRLPEIAARQRAYAERLQRRAAAHAAQLRAGDAVANEDRYDPDAEIRKRAMAEIRATVAARLGRPSPEAYRSDSPRANARRALLQHAAEENRRRVMGRAA